MVTRERRSWPVIASTNASFIFTLNARAHASFSADAELFGAANHPVPAINWVKIIIGLSADIINDHDFEQLTSITGSAPYSLLHLPIIRTHTYTRTRVYTQHTSQDI